MTKSVTGTGSELVAADLLAFDEDFINDNFFVITSEGDLESIPDKLYGYALDGGNFYLAGAPGHLLSTNANGAFVNVCRQGDLVIIQQDASASFGLFYFRKGQFWAISNSLFVLARRISRYFELEINQEYASCYLTILSAPLAYSETLFKDIIQMPEDVVAIIALAEKELVLESVKKPGRSLPIDSPEAIAIIDNWQDFWRTQLAALAKSGRLQIDLSGGFDTCANLTALSGARLGREDLYIYSMRNDNYTYPDDYAIAQEIASIMGFALNKNVPVKASIQPDAATSFSVWLMTRASFANQFGIINGGKYLKSPIFNVQGFGGGVLRRCWDGNLFEMVNSLLCLNLPTYRRHLIATRRVMRRCYEEIAPGYDFRGADSQNLYLKVRNRNHFGKAAAASFLLNHISISPLLDPTLNVIDYESVSGDGNLFFAILFDRFLPELADVRFDSGHVIAPETLRLARDLNRRYPWQPQPDGEPLRIIAGERVKPRICEAPQKTSPQAAIKDYYATAEMRDWVTQKFGVDTWKYGFEYQKTSPLFPDQFMTPLVAMRLFEYAAGSKMESALPPPVLPKAFDADWYRERYLGRQLDPPDALTHYLLAGRLAGNASSPLSYEPDFRNYIRDLAEKRKALVLFADKAPSIADVRAEYCVLPGSAREAPYVAGKGWDLSDIDGKWDVIYCAAGVMEAASDLIGFLQNVDRLLSPDGWFCCSAASKDYTEDYYQPSPTLGDAVEAHLNHGESNPRLRDLVDSRLISTHSDTLRHWQGNHQHFNRYIKGEIDAALAEFAEPDKAQPRRWFFNDSSFYRLMTDLEKSKYVRLQIARFYPAPYGEALMHAIFN